MARLLDLGIAFDHWCFACGRLNQTGLQLDFPVFADRAPARCPRTRPLRMRHAGVSLPPHIRRLCGRQSERPSPPSMHRHR